jgi:hypothetical protein
MQKSRIVFSKFKFFVYVPSNIFIAHNLKLTRKVKAMVMNNLRNVLVLINISSEVRSQCCQATENSAELFKISHTKKSKKKLRLIAIFRRSGRKRLNASFNTGNF